MVCADRLGMPNRQLEDLIVWQVAREVAADIYRQTRKEGFEHDRHLRAELRSAARSIMANLATGYGADNARGLMQGFARAAAAAVDLSSLTHLAMDLGLMERRAASAALTRTGEVAQLIRGWQRALQTHELARRLMPTRVN